MLNTPEENSQQKHTVESERVVAKGKGEGVGNEGKEGKERTEETQEKEGRR